MKFKKSSLFPVVSLFVICLVTALLVAGANALTKGPIEENERQALAESRRAVIEADEYREIPAEGLAGECAEAIKEGKTVGYVFKESAKGYGGDVTVMVGISLDGKIAGVKILSHSETPGLGARWDDEAVLGKFVGYGDAGSAGVRITGASITGRAVNSAADRAFEDYGKVRGDKNE